jgi:hypothetical protein
MSFSEASGIITQTGTDTDLSGLSNINGVTRYVEEDMIIYDVASTHRLVIEGTVHHDPEKEVLIIRHNWVSGSTPALHINYSTNNWKTITAITRDSDNRFVLTFASHGYQVGDAVEFQVTETGAEHLHQVVYPVTAVTTDTFTLGMTEYSDYLPTLSGATNRVTRRAVYNYGREITAFGNTRLSAGTGLLIVGNKENNFQERGSGIKTDADGLFRGRGGTIYSSRPTALNGYSDIDGTELVSPTLLDCRSMSGGAVKNFKLVNNQVSGAHVDKLLNRGFVLSEGVLMETLSQSYYEAILRDLDTSNNTGDADIGHSSNDTYPHRDWIIINSKAGSSVRGMFRSSTGLDGQSQKGVTVVKKEVSFNLKDSSGSAIQGVEMYMSDTPDPNYSKNATFPAPTDTARQYTSVLGTNTLGVLNANGTATYNYTNAIEYTGTSDASGLIDTLQVTTGVQILEYLSTDPSASSQGGNGGPYNIALNGSNQWVDGGARPSPSDWDTTRFDGFYKVDRRGNGNTDADLFTFKFCSYDHSLSSSTQALKGLGELKVDWVLVNDQLITDTKATADAYTEIDTPQKFYNRAKSYLVDNYAGETATIVSREGNSIDTGSYDVVVDGNVTDAASAFAISGNTLTIKATRFVGNIATTGTTTLSNGAVVIGTFGSTTVLPWEVKNVEGTSRIQLVNVTQNNTEVVNTKLTSSDPFIDASGTYTSSQIAVGDVVRLRVTCVVGATALLPVLQTGVATTTGIAFQVDQEADAIYNSNGIDASQITTFTADYTNTPMGIDLSESDGVATVQELYAYLVYAQTTADGVDKWFNAVRAIDGSNYQIDQTIADIKFQNVGSVAVNITGGRIFRKDGSSVLHAELGDYPITLDTGSLVTNILPQIEDALNNNAKLSSVDNNTKLIPGLF